ncbi:MAG TPA: CBS domain-containing protein [Dissulfurispiraceae bacterium]
MLRAKDIMTKEVVTVTRETTLEELGRIFIDKGISGAPVVDSAGRVICIVTENDLIRKNSRLHIPTILRLFDAYIPLGASKLEVELRKMTATTVGEVCTAKVTAITEDVPIDEIASIMNEKNIHLLPVTREGKVVGVIGKKDVIKGIARETSE